VVGGSVQDQFRHDSIDRETGIAGPHLLVRSLDQDIPGSQESHFPHAAYVGLEGGGCTTLQLISKTHTSSAIACRRRLFLMKSSTIFDCCQREDLAMHKAIASCVFVVEPNRLSVEEAMIYPVHSVLQTKDGPFDIIPGQRRRFSTVRVPLGQAEGRRIRFAQ
jgi:hypothetical protein